MNQKSCQAIVITLRHKRIMRRRLVPPARKGENMNNTNIIANAAVAAGFLTEEEVANLISEGDDIPFHTCAVWKQMGLCPKIGARGYATNLWRKKDKHGDVNEEIGEKERDQKFYLAKAVLFHISQCIPIDQLPV